MDQYKYIAVESINAEGDTLRATIVASDTDLQKVVSKTMRKTGDVVDIYKKINWKVNEIL